MDVYLRFILAIIACLFIIFIPVTTTSDQSGFPIEPSYTIEDIYSPEVVHLEDLQMDLGAKEANYKVEQQVWYSGNEEKRQVALTFDDGPDNYYTLQILDILQEHDIKATFFVIGSNVERFPEVVERIANEGHIIGNHSWSHKDFAKLSSNSMLEELVNTEEILYSIVGNKHTNIFRPPYGSYSSEVLEVIHSRNYNFVYWSVDTRDWANTPISIMVKTVSSQITPGGIILMHSSGSNQAMKNTVTALPEIIKTIKDLEYEFVTIPEVLGFKKQDNYHNLRGV
ncbi:MAG: hypothetical protein APF76_01140 [Desulfitibacter sp. BRH_c19]|nr:MAG: hypothetical protein APF76_01140 [Desulfitibacter sp. BRH_c19]